MQSFKIGAVIVIIALVGAMFINHQPTGKLFTYDKQLGLRKAGKIYIHEEVPILMYHSISKNDSQWQELCVSPDDFTKQVDWLAQQGYHTITLSDLYQHWYGQGSLPAKPIVLTFDDGYHDNYTVAYAAMQKYGFVGSIFIYVNKFKHGNSISIAEVQELIAAGWEIGCHSYTHSDLTTVDSGSLLKETYAARSELQEKLGVDISAFCYPSGEYNNSVLEAVANAGFTFAVTTDYGLASIKQNPLKLKRIRINGSDGIWGFSRKLQ